jgi:hypothetical protein
LPGQGKKFLLRQTFTFHERCERPVPSRGSNIGDDASISHSFGCGCGTPDIINGNPVLGSGGSREMQLGLKLTF